MALVVDASVAVEYLLRTELGRLLAPRLEAEPLLAPDLIDAETLAVLRKLSLADEISDRRARAALEDLTAWHMRRVPSRLLVSQAWEYRHNLSAYDALYVAAAFRFSAPLITADGPLSRAPVEGVLIENVRAG